MPRILSRKLSCGILSLGCFVWATILTAHPLLNAPGFTETQGGQGGRQITVTHLGASGPGSLNAAINATGPRVVVFKVAGVIDLNKRIIRIRQPNLTIAGETAPSPGITLIKGGIPTSSPIPPESS